MFSEYAPRDIIPGKPWGSSIIDAINNSNVFVLVYSTHTNLSNQVHREVERAVSKKIPILPFRVEDIQPSGNLEYFLSSTHWLNAYIPPLEDHLNQLTMIINELLPKRNGKKIIPSSFINETIFSINLNSR